MTPTEKRIYALAQKWAKATGRTRWRYGHLTDTGKLAEGKRSCGRALLKLFKEREGRGK